MKKVISGLAIAIIMSGLIFGLSKRIQGPCRSANDCAGKITLVRATQVILPVRD